MQPLADPIPNTCFMSCIKIIGQDLGFDLDIREFIARFPELCFKGTEKEGAFHVTIENLEEVSGKMGFTAAFTLELEAEYTDAARVLLSYHKFQGNEDHAHCQVFVKSFANDTMLLVLDPSKNDFDEIPITALNEWQCNRVIIKKA